MSPEDAEKRFLKEVKEFMIDQPAAAKVTGRPDVGLDAMIEAMTPEQLQMFLEILQAELQARQES
ncbi:hypothetical protein [Tuwongella immobilis]|uniref:hypothetical protein n=1 Tax=Tuwongella immobilis TaxID=692036 RepID=UPI001E47F658|nr:hypothetical protein [Tuwongella immobilis]